MGLFRSIEEKIVKKEADLHRFQSLLVNLEAMERDKLVKKHEEKAHERRIIYIKHRVKILKKKIEKLHEKKEKKEETGEHSKELTKKRTKDREKRAEKTKKQVEAMQEKNQKLLI